MYITRLDYQKDSVGVFAHFANQTYSVFLDSCGQDRFDVIAADPAHVIKINTDDQDVFEMTIDVLGQRYDLTSENTPRHLPFTIGAIGYLSYDLGFRLMGLKSIACADISLPLAVIGFYDWSIVTDHLEKITYLCSRKPVTDPQMKIIIHKIFHPYQTQEKFEITQRFQSNMSEGVYASAFSRIKEHIRAGDCYQINLAQRFSSIYQGSLWTAYQILRQQNPMPMAAFLQLQSEAVLCLSPERFITVDYGEVLTQPIKGTRGRFADPEQDRQSAQELLLSEKDRAENIMIVDLLRNDLSKCCRPGSVKTPKLCALHRFSNVHHLVSTVTGVLEEQYHPLHLLRHCFPGGSITGAPKRRAMEIIDQLEPHRRSLYCGSIFSMDYRGRLESNIAIRTLIGSQNRLHCYGGGGIVKDSVRELEFQEIQLKISKLIRCLETSSSFLVNDFISARY